MLEFGCVYATVVNVSMCRYALWTLPTCGSSTTFVNFFWKWIKKSGECGDSALYQFPSFSLHCACSEVNGQLDGEVERRRRSALERGR